MTYLIYDENDGTYCKGSGDWTIIAISDSRRLP